MLFRSASEDLCSYLFKDDGFGNVINPDGVAMRQDVFENWELEGSKGVVPYSNQIWEPTIKAPLSN